MQKLALIIFLVVVLGIIGIWYMDTDNNTNTPMEQNTEQTTGESDTMLAGSALDVTPISHATAVLNLNETVMYTDPVGGEEAFAGQPAPDIILLTDTHGDHLDIDTLQAVATESAMIIAPQAVADELPESLLSQTTVLANGESMSARGFNIEAVPMYNIPESEDAYHVKGRGNGYIIEQDGYDVYIAGDTSGTPEMRALEGIDVAFVPMNLPYTMGVEEAAEAVLDLAPAKVYPYHYRGQNGLSDVDQFKQLVESENENIEVVLLDWYPEQ